MATWLARCASLMCVGGPGGSTLNTFNTYFSGIALSLAQPTDCKLSSTKHAYYRTTLPRTVLQVWAPTLSTHHDQAAASPASRRSSSSSRDGYSARKVPVIRMLRLGSPHSQPRRTSTPVQRYCSPIHAHPHAHGCVKPPRRRQAPSTLRNYIRMHRPGI